MRRIYAWRTAELWVVRKYVVFLPVATLHSSINVAVLPGRSQPEKIGLFVTAVKKGVMNNPITNSIIDEVGDLCSMWVRRDNCSTCLRVWLVETTCLVEAAHRHSGDHREPKLPTHSWSTLSLCIWIEDTWKGPPERTRGIRLVKKDNNNNNKNIWSLNV